MTKKLIYVFSSLFLWISIFLWYNYYLKIENQKIEEQKKLEENKKIISDEIQKNQDMKQKILDSKVQDLSLNDLTTHNEKDIINPTKEELDTASKVEIIKKRFALKWTLTRWDDYFSGKQPILALNEYLKAYRQSPWDSQIIKKIALTYFDLKRFKNANNNFKEVKDILTQEEKDKYILSLFYDLNMNSKEEIKKFSLELKSLNLPKDDLFYYTNSVICSINFHDCKVNYEEYFKNNLEITNQKLLSIKNAINDYNNLLINEIYYKNTLIIWSLFKEKLYPITNKLSLDILKEKPDYMPLLLIVWKGYYDLWDLENSKKYLEKYYSLDPKNVEITYILWEISFLLKDYLTSSLYLNSALKNWYTPKIDLQRKLAYNYYISWDRRSMLNVFWTLIEVDDSQATIDDFSLWIYYAILEKRTKTAVLWAEKWLKKFNNTSWFEIFYWYLWWVNREEGKLEEAEKYLKTWLKINWQNPLILLNMWYLEASLEKYPLALVYLKKTISINWEWEFWELASKEIEFVEKKMNKPN